MRAESVARRLLSFRRLSVGKLRFEADDHGGEALVIEVKPRGKARCSRCGRKCPGYDRLKTRRWRHLDFGAHQVYLEAALARVECDRCGVVVEQVSWAEPDSRFTLHFEEMVGWLAQRCDKTAISTLLRIAWRSVGTILERVVARHRAEIDWTQVTAIAVDELSFRKGQHYLTLVSDLQSGRILWSREGRSAATLEAFFSEIGAEACARIRHAAIDMLSCGTLTGLGRSPTMERSRSCRLAPDDLAAQDSAAQVIESEAAHPHASSWRRGHRGRTLHPFPVV